MKKKIIKVIIFALVALSCAFPTIRGDTKTIKRVIHVVYDDSGSMYQSDDKPVDTWCQAKYSMEVFAAMLGDNDTMNVYYMSDYQTSTQAKPRMILSGSDGAEANVAKIHSEKTKAGSTPFNSVRKAYSDLTKANADEKWLVILTDGEFEEGRMKQKEVDAFLGKKKKDIKVMFLGMGPKAAGTSDKPDQGIYYEEAKTNDQILDKITGICTRVFNSNKLTIDIDSKTTSFDVPMGELIVFAQGKEVSINGIEDPKGQLIKSSKAPVGVKYSNCDASNYKNSPAKGLVGSIATFKSDFDAGTYTVDVEGAKTIEIYYKPNVEVAAYLTDASGKNVEDLANLVAGEYTISFGFVKAGTTEKVSQSKLLGDVTYEATVTNNGNKHDKIYSDGDKITLEEGDLNIDVKASYLKYNSVSTSLNYSIYKDKEITFTVVNNPEYNVTSSGFEKKNYIEIEAKIDGKEFTAQQWEKLETPKIVLTDEGRDFKIENPKIEKTKDIGKFKVIPVLTDDKPSTGDYTNCNYKITHKQKVGSETWSGALSETIKIKDSRSLIEKYWDRIIKIGITLLILLLIIGYLPFVKHYLPKSLKKKPYIKCIPSEPGERRKSRNGSFEKNLASTLIPYIPQTGTIKYVPKGVTGAPALMVKAIKRRRMTLTNIKSFVGKDYITFDGETIKKDSKKFDTGAGVCIKVKRGEWTYVCTLNQANNEK